MKCRHAADEANSTGWVEMFPHAKGAPQSFSAIHFAPMSEVQHQYEKLFVVSVVDDPVIADLYPKFTITTLELNTTQWTRVFGQLVDRRQQPSRYRLVKLAQSLRRRCNVADRVAHRAGSDANLLDEILVIDSFELITRRGGGSNVSLIFQRLQSTVIELWRHYDGATARPS